MAYLRTFLRLTSIQRSFSSLISKSYIQTIESSKAVKHVPAMVFATEKKRNTISNLLETHGFSKGQITHLFNSSVPILHLNKKELSDILSDWILAFEANDKLFTTLTAHPELLTLDPEYVNSRVKELMTIFTNKDIQKLLVTSPNVFLDDFSEITEKVEYIVHKMGVEQKSIIKSCALQFSLDHIKCRHNFMARAGFYRVEKKEVKSKNPPLNKVFSRNIETFLKLTKLSKEEYLTFFECYKDELEEERQAELEEEDDDLDDDD